MSMKANELKSTDLMVGDWLMFNDKPCQVKGLHNDDTVTLTGYRSMYYLIDAEPIPLTPEILGKNFELLLSKKGIYIYSGIEGRLIIQNHYNVKGWYWSLDYDKQTGTASAFGRVNYIHELQHYLRGNRIDKEIVV